MSTSSKLSLLSSPSGRVGRQRPAAVVDDGDDLGVEEEEGEEGMVGGSPKPGRTRAAEAPTIRGVVLGSETRCVCVFFTLKPRRESVKSLVIGIVYLVDEVVDLTQLLFST